MLDVAFTWAQVRPAETAIVIDVLRATSTITLALAAGYERVLVVDRIERAEALRGPGRVLAGERRCERPPGFDLGNSPADVRPPRGAELVLATTNGAPAIVAAARACDEVLVASMLNLEAVRASVGDGDVLLVCAGTDGAVTIEDVYLAGRLCAALPGPRSDAARITEALAASYASALDALEASAGAHGLRRTGLEADIAFCAQESIVDTVPRLAETIGDVAVLQTASVAAGERPRAGTTGQQS